MKELAPRLLRGICEGFGKVTSFVVLVLIYGLFGFIITVPYTWLAGGANSEQFTICLIFSPIILVALFFAYGFERVYHIGGRDPSQFTDALFFRRPWRHEDSRFETLCPRWWFGLIIGHFFLPVFVHAISYWIRELGLAKTADFLLHVRYGLLVYVPLATVGMLMIWRGIDGIIVFLKSLKKFRGGGSASPPGPPSGHRKAESIKSEEDTDGDFRIPRFQVQTPI